MTFSILWLVLASTVTVIALMRRTCAPNAGSAERNGEGQFRQPGRALTLLGVVYSMILLAGFLYIAWQHSLEFMK